MIIRHYETNDVDSVIDVWLNASKVAHPFLKKDFIESETVNMRELYLPNAETWVVENEGAIVGFLALIGNEVGGLFVDPKYHGLRFGKTLMDKAVALRGALELDVFQQNHIGRRFYARYGFWEDHEYEHEATGECVIRLKYAPEEGAAQSG
ncbi:GNAT family N-acetyltransferase [Kordiimonas sp.]|uniref:GNAT family N-acetyltransferase n=1 Tax=Kordiimonas sp. TaxID=1970157 RepID=UPI003A959A21